MQMRNKPIFTFGVRNLQKHCPFMYCLHILCKKCPTVYYKGAINYTNT